MLTDQRVLLGVTGSIAAYKACDIVQRLREKGAEVRVVMTPSATRLIQPATYAALTGSPVTVDAWADAALGSMSHIEDARWATIFLIAPCTAHTLAELAMGLTGSSVSMTALAYAGRLILAPAMNTVMLDSKVTQENIHRLESRGAIVLPTLNGTLACGEKGEGKLLTPEEIVAYVDLISAFGGDIPDLKGKRVLISGGHTEEPLDGVRFLSNRSSGKTAIALARAFRLAGANVKMVLGVTELPPPSGISIVPVSTSEGFHQGMLAEQGNADIVIMAAAIADFVPAQVDSGKWKDSKSLKSIGLKPSINVLNDLGQQKIPGQLLIGFALETQNAIPNAWEKLQSRKCDWVVVNNPLSQTGSGFGEDQVEAAILSANQPPTDIGLLRMDKNKLAVDLARRVAAKLPGETPA